jgi:hypothetical protein
MDHGEHVEFENERVKVIRVKVQGKEKHARKERGDRVLIWLTDSHVVRAEHGGKRDEVHRRAGEVAFRKASQHEVENTSHDAHELIIVELKD